MNLTVGDVFADSAYRIALVVKQDQHHAEAQRWSLLITGRMITTTAVLLETANALARPSWRSAAISLLEHLQIRQDVTIVPLTPDHWRRGWELYRSRGDKSWSLTDCISFVVMQDSGLSGALTSDEHFRQAGFRALLLESQP
jgi:uncharacterized protein